MSKFWSPDSNQFLKKPSQQDVVVCVVTDLQIRPICKLPNV